jgi:hypothetical protein
MSYTILKGGWADAGESIDAYNDTINFVRRRWSKRSKGGKQ